MAKIARHIKGELDFLMVDPLVLLRSDLAMLSKGPPNSFGYEEYLKFVERIQHELGANRSLQKEVFAAHEFLQTGEKIEQRLFLRDPRSQLLWAATLIHMMSEYEAYCERWQIGKELNSKNKIKPKPSNDNPNNKTPTEVKVIPIKENPLYLKLLNNRTTKTVMLDYAYYVTQMAKNPDVKFSWGLPNTWFYYNLEKNFINIDLLQTLIAGFRDTLAIVFHEIGHSQLTLEFPKQQQEIVKKLQPFQDKKKKKEKFTEDEYKEYRVLSKYLQLRHSLSDACENAPVNRFAANRAGYLGRFLSGALNRIFMSVSGGGLKYTQYKNTEKLEENLEGSQDSSESTEDSIEDEFLSKALGEKKADKKKDKPQHDSNLVPEEGLSDEDPNKLFQNVIWAVNTVFFNNNKLFGSILKEWKKVGVEPDLIKLDPDIRDTVLREFPEARNHWNPDLAVLIELCGADDGLEHLQPDAADRYKFGDDYFNVKTDTYQVQRNEINQKIWDWYLKRTAEKLLEQEEEKAEQDLENGDGDPEEGNDQDGDGIDVEGADNMPDPNPPPEDAAGSQDNDNDGQEQDGQKGQAQDGAPQDGQGNSPSGNQDGEEEQGKTLAELLEDLKNSQEESENSDELSPGQEGGKGEGVKSLEELAEGSFENYQELVEQLQSEISIATRMLQQFQKKQITQKPQIVKSNHTLTPEYNDIGRLNRDRHIAKAKQTDPSLEDRKIFKSTRKRDNPAEFELTLGIDGSTSMTSLMDGVDPLKAAILKSIIIYEACRRLGQNSYIYIWGNDKPIILAEPGDTYHKIGESMSRIEKGLQCGTNFLPAIKAIVEKTAFNRKKTKAFSGYTHHIILSDGDTFGDKAEAVKHCKQLLNEGLLQTLDFEIIRKNFGDKTVTGLQNMACEMNSDNPRKNVGVNVSFLNKIDITSTLNMVLGKLVGQPTKAIPTSKKKKSLQRVSMRWGLK